MRTVGTWLPYRSARKLNLKAKRRHALREPSNKPEIHLSPTPTLSLSHYYFASFVRLIHSPQLSSNWETREYERSCLRCTVNLYGGDAALLLLLSAGIVIHSCVRCWFRMHQIHNRKGFRLLRQVRQRYIHTYVCMYMHTMMKVAGSRKCEQGDVCSSICPSLVRMQICIQMQIHHPQDAYFYICMNVQNIQNV